MNTSRSSAPSRLASVILLAAQLCACGVEQLPPPAAPPREVPGDLDVPPEPPAPGQGRVVLDVPGEKAQVHEITGVATAHAGGYAAHVIGSRKVCKTPCVVDLPYGSHPLVFASTTEEGRMSEVEIEVGPRPKVVRHALGERTSGGAARTIGATLLVLGATTALTGALLWGVGAALKNPDGSRGGLETAGMGLTAGGAIGIGLSIPLLFVGRPTERKGTTTEWSLPLGPVAPASPVGTDAQTF